MLEIENLEVAVENKTILKKVSFSFEKWKTYFLLGRNWSGKSSLAMSVAGHPKYKITSGNIDLDWENIAGMEVQERNKAWIFLSFQNIPEIKWIKLIEFLRTIFNEHQKGKDSNFKEASFFLFKRKILPYLKELNIPENFLERDLNVGFSGWEKRKIELLQIKLLNPKYIILDEIDSGLDIDAFRIVAMELEKIRNKDNTMIFITHNFKLLEYIWVDEVYVIDSWKVIDNWWRELIEKIEKEWFCGYCKENCDHREGCA